MFVVLDWLNSALSVCIPIEPNKVKLMFCNVLQVFNAAAGHFADLLAKRLRYIRFVGVSHCLVLLVSLTADEYTSC